MPRGKVQAESSRGVCVTRGKPEGARNDPGKYIHKEPTEMRKRKGEFSRRASGDSRAFRIFRAEGERAQGCEENDMSDRIYS